MSVHLEALHHAALLNRRKEAEMSQAKTLTPEQLGIVFNAVERLSPSEFKLRNTLMLALSRFAGLRAQEIAYLQLEDVTNIQGRLSDVLHVTKRAGKYGKERWLPLPRPVKELIKAHINYYEITRGPLFWNRWDEPISPDAVQK
jgi:integrase